MSFQPWDTEQSWLLPPSIHDFVPRGHVAHFVRDTVRETLDLTAIIGRYDQETGRPAYHPAMMVALLLYAYSQGVYSSRRIARACEERVDFMAVTGLAQPDHRTVNRFRGRHLQDLEPIFVQVVQLCGRAGLVKLGHVALDGTRVKANASRHSAMSYGRMKDEEKKLKDVVAAWLEKAADIDAAEDEEFGEDRRGDELPDWAKDRVKRLEKIREAKAALEAEARAAAEAEARDRVEGSADTTKDGSPRKRPEAKPKHGNGTPDDKAQRNFTDPESRVMKTRDGFEQCYNAQAAVDSSSQVIVACDLSNSGSDHDHLPSMLSLIEAATGRQASELSADASYCSEANLAELERHDVRAYVATGRASRSSGMGSKARGPFPQGTLRSAMWQRLRRAAFRSRYRLRKQTVEPVFGQIKEARGFRRFLLRGLVKVRQEWTLICTVHNLLKLARATT